MQKSYFTRSKDLDKFLRTLSASEFQVLRPKSGHASLLHLPTNTKIPIPNTPSCSRALVNFKSQIRRLAKQAALPKPGQPEPPP